MIGNYVLQMNDFKSSKALSNRYMHFLDFPNIVQKMAILILASYREEIFYIFQNTIDSLSSNSEISQQEAF